MPRSQLDRLGVVTLRVGALVLAVKGAAAPLTPEAPVFLPYKWLSIDALISGSTGEAKRTDGVRQADTRQAELDQEVGG